MKGWEAIGLPAVGLRAICLHALAQQWEAGEFSGGVTTLHIYAPGLWGFGTIVPGCQALDAGEAISGAVVFVE